MKTTEQLQIELADKRAELADVQAKLAQMDDLIQRERHLTGGWGRTGEIRDTERKLEESQWPIYSDDHSCMGAVRIIAVCNKWVTIRRDGSDDANQHSIETGNKKGARGQFASMGAIDIPRALEIWAAHIAKP